METRHKFNVCRYRRGGAEARVCGKGYILSQGGGGGIQHLFRCRKAAKRCFFNGIENLEERDSTSYPSEGWGRRIEKQKMCGEKKNHRKKKSQPSDTVNGVAERRAVVSSCPLLSSVLLLFRASKKVLVHGGCCVVSAVVRGEVHGWTGWNH